MQFQAEELIVYGESGVCRVLGVEPRPFLDRVINCYKLQPLYQSCVIYTPTENGNVFMRQIISKEEAKDILDGFLNSPPLDLPTGAPRVVTEYYSALIKTHDCRTLASLITSVYRKRQRLITEKKKLSAIDERFMKKAEDLLFGELAAALELTKPDLFGIVAEMVNA